MGADFWDVITHWFETSKEYADRHEKEARDAIRRAKGREPTEKEVEDYLYTESSR